jgi:DNA-binding transcriptional ArsR family regulator
MPADDLWRALASPVRRRLLDGMRRGPRTTTELAKVVPSLSRFAVMQHLEVLEKAGLVVVRRQGRERHNYLNAVPLRQMYERWVSRFAGRVAGESLTVKQFVEAGVDQGARLNTGKDETGMDESIRVLRIENEVSLEATPAAVFDAITVQFGEWWPHRLHDGAHVVFEPQLGGRVFEEWGDGSASLYAEVTHFEPPARLCLRGPWGLDRESYVIMWWSIEPADRGSVLRRSFRAWGLFSDELAERYRKGARTAIEVSLKAYLERGATSAR